MKSKEKVKAGVRAIRVDGWDSKCEVFVTDKTKEQLHGVKVQFELLNAKSTECYLVEAPDGTPLVFLGIVPFTLLGGEAYIWMIPFEGLRARYLREMKKLFEVLFEKFTKMTAQVYYCDTGEERFVKYFGFVRTQKVNGMIIYERKK